MNSVAQVMSCTRKYDRGLTELLHTDLHWHWEAVAERVAYNLCMTVYKCLHSQAPDYLVRAVYAGRPSRRTTAPSFGQPPPTRRATDTARHVRPEVALLV